MSSEDKGESIPERPAEPVPAGPIPTDPFDQFKRVDPIVGELYMPEDESRLEDILAGTQQSSSRGHNLFRRFFNNLRKR